MLALTPLPHIATDVPLGVSLFSRCSEVAAALEARWTLGPEVVVATAAVGEPRVPVAHGLGVG